MPFHINNIYSESKTKIIFSQTVELVAALHLLSDKMQHKFLPDWVEYVLSSLTPDSSEFLKLVSDMNFPGMGLYDFITKDDIFDDVEALMNTILNFPDIDLIYVLFNGEIERDKLQHVRGNPNEFYKIVECLSIAASGTEKALKTIVYDTENYKNSLVKLLKEIYSLRFIDQLHKLQDDYVEIMLNIERRLKSKSPIELAEEIRGSKVSSRKYYKEYIFTPSFFLYHRDIASYTDEKFMFVCNINIDKTDPSHEAERIADLLKVLSEKSRLEILRQLKVRTTYGKMLASRLNLTTATISRHLEQLRAINLIREEKADNVKYFNINSEELDKLLEDIKNFINGC